LRGLKEALRADILALGVLLEEVGFNMFEPPELIVF
jgi:hypothetical protein